MFKGQPKGLYALALANTGERFGYYTMLAVFVLYLKANFGLSAADAGQIYSTFLMFVYFLPFVGGILADKFGYGKMVTIGIFIMFLGYAFLSLPLGTGGMALAGMYGALLLISCGTGLFKGNLQVLVGNLYDNPEYESKRDSAFSIFYMAINIGALFAPSAAVGIKNYAINSLGLDEGTAYHFAFAVACVSLIVSIAIYYAFRGTFKHAEGGAKKKASAQEPVRELSKEETKSRIVALCLVFAVVIFFWMAFHQNGLTLTFFARDYTATTATGLTRIGFDVINLVLIIIAVYGLFSFFQSEKGRTKLTSGAVTVASLALLAWKYSAMGDASIAILPQKFQQFNPFFVVALTPVSMAVFGALAKRGKEPSAPRKIGIGMFIAALGFTIMALGSFGLPIPNDLASVTTDYRVTPNLLIGTYLVLTFAELFLSPMGISFVSKVAPPKYKGLMMGGWFAATAVGNYMVAIIGMLWGGLPLWVLWSILIVLCLVSALFIFSIMKKLENATA